MPRKTSDLENLALHILRKRLEINPLKLLCPKCKELTSVTDYFLGRGYRLSCGHVRPSALGKKEPSVLKLMGMEDGK